MLPKKIYAVYFSATGTTQKLVRRFAETVSSETGLPVEAIDFTPPKARETPLVFTLDDFVVVGMPVYAGRLPNLIMPYLKTWQGGGAAAASLVLYGNRNFDDALMELTMILREDGFYPVAAGAFIGEHSFSKVLGAGRPDEKDLAKADELAVSAARFLKENGTDAPQNELRVEGQWPLRPYYTPRDRHGKHIDIRKVKPKTNENCQGCGKCVAACPMGAIEADCKTVSGICIKCCACEKGCPNGAKYFDDAGYLYHARELEEQFAAIRREPVRFCLKTDDPGCGQ